MNKNLYRIVFNKRRGQLMVVGEHASAQGKAASGDDGTGGGDGVTRLRNAGVAVIGALALIGVSAGAAHGQIVADPNAPGGQRPTVLQTASGVPQVNIQTPSAAGVSRNTYSQFDVQANGAVLNNSRGNVQTATGGWVQGNPWLAGGSARVILNEVNSSNPSQLRGYVEVAGQRAEVVIANPAGLNVDGGGFINASRVTLTTGTPIINGGSLDGYMVQRGLVTINGRGLDTSTSDYTAILARAAQVNAGIWANDLTVVTGVNHLDAAPAPAVLGGGAADAGGAPTFALDVAQLGGMYAGKITLLGTEAGIGVRNAGTLAASAGNVVLQSNGWLLNSGQIQASAGNVGLSLGGAVSNSGAVYASGATQVTSVGNISNSGVIAAAGNTTLRADGAGARIESSAAGVLAAGLGADNLVGASGDLQVAASGVVALAGTAAAGGAVALDGSRLELGGINLFGAGIAMHAAEGDIDLSRTVIAARDALTLRAAATLHTDGAQLSGGQVNIAAHDLSNVGGQITQLGAGQLALRLPGQIDNSQGHIASNSVDMTLAAATLINTDGKIAHAGSGALAIDATALLDQRGQIVSNGAMALTAGSIDHRDAASVAAQVTIAAGSLDNRGGSIAQTGNSQARIAVAQNLDNRAGSIDSNGSLTLAAATLGNAQGRISALQDVSASSDAFDNGSGALAAGRQLQLAASTLDNTGGQIQALAGSAVLTLGDVNNNGGSIFASANLATSANNVNNSGTLYAGGNQTLSVNGAIDNTGVIAAQGHNTVSAARVASGASSLLGAGVRADGQLSGAGDLTVSAVQGLDAHGQNSASGNVAMRGATLDLSGSQTGARNIALSAGAGVVDTSTASVITPGTLTVAAANHTLQNVGGTLSAGQLDLHVGTLDNSHGTLLQSGAADLAISTGALDNTAGRIASNSANQVVTTAALNNAGGSIEHAGSGTLALNVAALDNSGGHIASAGAAIIASATTLANTGGSVAAARQLTLGAASIDNAGELRAGTELALAAGSLRNSGSMYAGGNQTLQVDSALTNSGAIAAFGNTTVVAGSIASTGLLGAGMNADGSSAAAGALTLTSTGNIVASGTNLAAGTAALRGATLDLSNSQTGAACIALTATGGDIRTAAARLASTGGLAINTLAPGAALDNRAGQLSAGQLVVNVGSVNNVAGALLQSGAGAMVIEAATLENASGSIQAAAGDMTLRIGDLNNGTGSVYAGASLHASLGNLSNSGSLYAAGNMVLDASGGIDNRGVIAALANTSLAAYSVNSAAGSLTGAGVRADGSLAGNADLSITSLQALRASGQNLASGQATLSGATVDVSGSQTGAASIALRASGGDVNTSKASVITPGTLSITAVNHVLANASGTLSAAQLDLQVGALDNNHGTLLQTGAADLAVSTGALDNTAGRIATNSANLALTTAALNNAGGSIEHAGSGALTLATATLDNSGGRIASAGAASIDSAGALLNTGGSVVAAQQLALVAGDLDNTSGLLHGGANLTLAATSLSNRNGELSSGANLDVQLHGNLLNDGLMYAGGDQTLAIGGVLGNSGSIAARGNTQITAGSVTSSGLLGAGMLADGTAAVSGALTVTSSGNLSANGQNLAAGALTLRGAALDLSTSKSGGAQIALTATSGDIRTSAATIATSGALNIATLSGGALDNRTGQLSAGQLVLAVGDLNNAGGDLLQTGSADTVIHVATLDNTAGRIGSNGANLVLTATALANAGGAITHAGSGASSINVAATLDNNGGSIDGNGEMQLNAGLLLNRAGAIVAAGDAVIGAGTLDNTGGALAAAKALGLTAGAVDNSGGSIRAVAGDATLHLGDLANTAGSVFAGANLGITAGKVSNSGSLYAGGNQTLVASGAIDNTGVIAALGNTSLSGDSLNSNSSSLIGAGIRADGTLTGSGNLVIDTTQTLHAGGQNLASGNATLRGASIDLGASVTGAANLALTATSGSVSTSAAMVTTPGTLAINAATAGGQGWSNRQGDVSAGQLQVQVAQLDNTGGALVQTGAGDTTINLASPTGTLDNSGGRIAVNSANLTLGAATLANTDGRIEHAGSGTLQVNAGSLNDQRGEITANGSLAINAGQIDHRGASTLARQLTINATTLDNSGGELLQTGGGQTTIAISGNLANTGGSISSNGQTGISALNLNNQNGVLQAAGTAALTVTAGATLDNRAGAVASGGNVTLGATGIVNQNGQVTAGGTLVVNATQALSNAAGLLAANGNLNVTAGSLDNTGGKLASVNGNLGATVAGSVVNDSGQVQAAGDITLNTGALSNALAGGYAAAGLITGRNVSIDTNGQSLNNALGTIGAGQALTLSTGALGNDGGLLQSGAALSIDTHGQALTNINTGAYAVHNGGASGGISSGGGVSLNLGSWNNSGGSFGAGGSVTGYAGQLNNAGGQIVGMAGVTLGLAGLANAGGQIQALGNISLDAGGGMIDNYAGLIRSGGTVTLSAGSIGNGATLGSNQGIEGSSLNLTAGIIDNSGGALRAANDLGIHSGGSFNNTGGLASANNILAIEDASANRALAVVNEGGTMIAGTLTAIRAGSLSGGRILSQQDMTLDLGGNYTLGAGAELTANRNATITVAGNFSNAGTLQAGATLTLGASNLDNSASGDINAGITRLNIANTLTNRGVIDGIYSEINAGTVNNVGTGRLYGDALSIAAGTINNDVENGVGATIAARGDLQIGAQTVSNREHALIFSGGNMAIAGSLDGNRLATGSAGTVTNASATIEALGNLSIAAGEVDVLNNHLTVTYVPTGASEHVVMYSANGKDYLFGAPGVSLGTVRGDRVLTTPDGKTTEFSILDYTQTTSTSVVTGTDPGVISAGGNLSVTANKVLNDNSQIVAGNQLSIVSATLENRSSNSQTITKTGTESVYVAREPSHAPAGYVPPPVATHPIDSTEIIGSAGGANTSYQNDPAAAPAARAGVALNGSTSTAGAANARVVFANNAGSATQVAAAAAVAGQQAGAATGADGLATTTRTGGMVRPGDVNSAGGIGGIAVDSSASIGSVGSAGNIGNVSATPGATGAGNLGSAAKPTAGAAVDAHGVRISALAAATTVGASNGASQAPAISIAQVALATPTGSAQVVRTATQSARVPSASLYKVSASPSASYLVETDPRFADYRTWTGSDYLTSLVQLDPTVTQKRLGDGFYEQQLVREQVAQLTGQRYLADYSDDEAQYRALMEAGAAYATAHDLHPGIALTAEQMAALTTDIVWLVEQTVVLADGSTQKALVPQVYVRLKDGDLDGSGALLAGKDVSINLSGDLTNSGTIAGRNVVLLNAENVQNLAGRIQGDTVAVAAQNDLNNISGTITAGSALQATAGRDINIATRSIGADGTVSSTRSEIDNVAGLYVTGNSAGAGSLIVVAGRDVNVSGAVVSNTAADANTALAAARDLNVTAAAALSSVGAASAQLKTSADAASVVTSNGSLTLHAGNDINNLASSISAGQQLSASAGRDINLASSTASTSADTRRSSTASTVIDQVASMAVTGTGAGTSLVLSAGRDVSLTAAAVGNAGVDGATSITAGRDLNLTTLITSTRNDVIKDAYNYSKESSSTEVGSQITGAGSVTLRAGNDVNLKAAQIDAGTALQVAAGNDINVTAGVATYNSEQATKTSKSGFLKKKTTVTLDTLATTSAVASSLGGDTVMLAANHDLSVTGSTVLGDNAVTLMAGNALTIAAAVDTSLETHHNQTTQSGLLGGGGFGISYGTRTTTTDQERDAATQSGLARSLVGSVDGDLTLSAGSALKIGGSDIAAGQDMNLLGQSVTVDPGVDDIKTEFKVKTVQDGFTVKIGGSVVNAIQTFQGMQQAAEATKNKRVQAMAAATAAMAAKNAAADIAKNGASVSISLTAGHSESEQTQTTTELLNTGTTLAAGNNLNIVASGAGKESNIDILGSSISAGGNITLAAENQVNLLSAQDLETQHSKSSSMSAEAGIAATVGTSGTAFGFTASVSASQGHEDGDGSTQVNTTVNAGKTLLISSGGDTNIRGAVATGAQVVADIGGNLNLESLQDTAKFDSKTQSINVSGTVGFGASVSGSYNQSTISSDYASVQQQSGIRAGDGGFQINVAGNTDLKGAVISSTAAGIANNSLSTGTLTQSEIKNYSVAESDSMGLSGSANVAGTGTKDASQQNVGDKPNVTDNRYEAGKALIGNAVNNGSASLSSGSTTTSGISAGSVTITNGDQQKTLTGQDATAAVAEINRDTSNTNSILKEQDYQQLAKETQIKQAFANAAFAELATHADIAHTAMFVKDNKYYKVTCPGGPNDCLKQPDALVMTEISKSEAVAMGDVLAVNGIFNDKVNRAGQLAYQNAPLTDDLTKPESIVLMHIPEAATTVSELMVAGYEKLLAPAMGYTNSDSNYANLIEERGEQATLALGHSRGTIVQYNAFSILAEKGVVSPNLSVAGVGGAIMASSYFDAAQKVIGPIAADNLVNPVVSYTFMKNDPVPVLSAFNSLNPVDIVSSILTIPDLYFHSNSPHSCYGSGAAGCVTIADPAKDGVVPAKQDSGNVVKYVNGIQQQK